MKHPVHGYHLKDAQGRKSVQEIVRVHLENAGQEKQFEHVYKTLHKLLASNKFRILRHGDTLFLLGLLGDNACHVQMINADSKTNLIRNIKEGFRAAFHAGFKRVDFETQNQNIVRAVQSLGHNIYPNGTPNGYSVGAPQ